MADRDLRDRDAGVGRDVAGPAAGIMSPLAVTAGTADPCFEALLEMIRHGIHHLPSSRAAASAGW